MQYRKNMYGNRDSKKHEKQILKKEGIKPIALSGASWIEKEDGQDEVALYQLKSTEKGSIAVRLLDVLELIKNAILKRKIPIFLLDFQGEQKVLLYCFRRKEDIIEYAEYLKKQANVHLKENNL